MRFYECPDEYVNVGAVYLRTLADAREFARTHASSGISCSVKAVEVAEPINKDMIMHLLNHEGWAESWTWIEGWVPIGKNQGTWEDPKYEVKRIETEEEFDNHESEIEEE